MRWPAVTHSTRSQRIPDLESVYLGISWVKATLHRLQKTWRKGAACHLHRSQTLNHFSPLMAIWGTTNTKFGGGNYWLCSLFVFALSDALGPEIHLYNVWGQTYYYFHVCLLFGVLSKVSKLLPRCEKPRSASVKQSWLLPLRGPFPPPSRFNKVGASVYRRYQRFPMTLDSTGTWYRHGIFFRYKALFSRYRRLVHVTTDSGALV